jgi:IS30 family transposase
MEERRVIARMHEKKISQAEIVRTLGRDRLTISRESRRNFWHDREVPIAEGYWPKAAGVAIASGYAIHIYTLRSSTA